MRFEPVDRIVGRFARETDLTKEDARRELLDRLAFVQVVNQPDPWELFEAGIYRYAYALSTGTPGAGLRAQLRVRNVSDDRIVVVERAKIIAGAVQCGLLVNTLPITSGTLVAPGARDSRMVGRGVTAALATQAAEVRSDVTLAAVAFEVFIDTPIIGDACWGLPIVIAPAAKWQSGIEQVYTFYMQATVDATAFTPAIEICEIELRARG